MSNNQLTSGKDRVTVPHCGQHINKTKMVEAGGDAAAGGEAGEFVKASIIHFVKARYGHDSLCSLNRKFDERSFDKRGIGSKVVVVEVL